LLPQFFCGKFFSPKIVQGAPLLLRCCQHHCYFAVASTIATLPLPAPLLLAVAA